MYADDRHSAARARASKKKRDGKLGSDRARKRGSDRPVESAHRRSSAPSRSAASAASPPPDPGLNLVAMYANNVSNLDQILSSLQCYTVRLGSARLGLLWVQRVTRAHCARVPCIRQQSSRVRADVYNLLGQIPSLQPNCGTFSEFMSRLSSAVLSWWTNAASLHLSSSQ